MLQWNGPFRRTGYRTHLLCCIAFVITSLCVLSYFWLPDAPSHAQSGMQPKLPRISREYYKQPSEFQRLAHNSLINSQPSAYDHPHEAGKECTVHIHQTLSFPDCLPKIEWLRSHWRSHPCYGELGVDGSECSVLQYLSEFEGVCPVMENRRHFMIAPDASINYDLDALLQLIPLLIPHSSASMFMRTRLKRLWPYWTSGMREYESWNKPVNQTSATPPIVHPSNEPFLDCIPYDERELLITRHPHFHGRSTLKIHLHLGFLSSSLRNYSDDSIGEVYLAELSQWTDLLASLFLLGHNISLSVEPQSIFDRFQVSSFLKTPCQIERVAVDLVYTNVVGFRQLKAAGLRIPDCKYRVLDSLGEGVTSSREKDSIWNGLSLNLRQFYTMFPYSPDNTFLGFVIGHSGLHGPPVHSPLGKPRALIYGEQTSMLKETVEFLRTLAEFFDLQANVVDAKVGDLPDFLTNHARAYDEYLDLVKSCQVMIGLGSPYSSPIPLQAIAMGVVFVNPRFNPLHDRSTAKKITSQHPYLERYVGEPYSYLVDIHNASDVRRTMSRILNSLDRAKPFHSFEFSTVGFIERINALLQHQRLCDGPSGLGLLQSPLPIPDVKTRHFKTSPLELNRNVVMWPPPLTALHIILAAPGLSCAEACERLAVGAPYSSFIHPLTSEYLRRRSLHFIVSHELVNESTLRCAPEHFSTVNSHFTLERMLNFSCSSISIFNNSTAPHWESGTGKCVFQASLLRFDCTSIPPTSIARFCPCRDALFGQPTLCATCV